MSHLQPQNLQGRGLHGVEHTEKQQIYPSAQTGVLR